MSATEYDFGWSNTVDLSPFVVDFSTATKAEVPRHGKNGDYTSVEWSVVIQSAKLSTPVRITGISAKNFDRMRVLSLMRLKNLTVTRGLAAVGVPASFAPYIISGVA